MNNLNTKNCWKAFLIFLSLMLSGISASSQMNTYQFADVGVTEEYKTVTFCRTNNYYWDQGVVDRSGKIHFVFVDNYKLVCFTSGDGGENWTKEQILTGKEGYLFTAMMTLTQNDKRVIVYAVNTGFNNGIVGFGSEFIYDVFGAVEQDDGSWTITPLYTHSANSGLLPYGMITVKSGKVHTVLYKYGWYSYGGELHEVIYDPSIKTWSSIQPIKIFNDRNVDNFTAYVGKLAEGENESIICMYQRNGSVSGKHNVEIVVKTSEGWQEPAVILENNSYSTYNRFDVDYDRHGNTFIGYFEPWGPSGPQIFLAHNSISSFTRYELFQATDTLIKMSIHPHSEKRTLLYCNFKNSMPKILEWTEDGLSVSDFLPAYETGDSLDVKRFHYNIPRKNNFSESAELMAFTNRYSGKNGDNVIPYPIVFVRANLVRDVTGVEHHGTGLNKLAWLFPNPADDFLEIHSQESVSVKSVRIYNTLGMLVSQQVYTGSGKVNVSGLSSGVYIVSNQDDMLLGRFIKK